MKFGFSGEAFGNLLVLSALVLIAVEGVIFFIAHKKGVDVTKHRFALTVGVSGIVIFAVIPLWFSDLSVKPKIIVTIAALAVGLGNYFAIDRLQKALREQLGDRKKKEGDGR
jgi:hypothetical protein